MTTHNRAAGSKAAAFGLRWDSDIALRHFAAADFPDGSADIRVRRATAPPGPRQAVVTIDNATLCTDGVRYAAGRQATFDTLGGGAVAWRPGEAWSGGLPAIFFSTLTALMLAWRGAIPLHGTAVEINDEAVLICGPSGAGKSTLAAGLIALGGRLISDDLSVLHPRSGTAGPALFTGRPSIRLFPAIAGFVGGEPLSDQDFGGDKGKCAVAPPCWPQLTPIALTSVILLDADPRTIAGQRSALLRAQMFRPRWMRNLRGASERLAALDELAHIVQVTATPAADIRSKAKFLSHAQATLESIMRPRSGYRDR